MATAAVTFFKRPGEPTYKGKPMSEWLGMRDDALVSQAMANIGTNAIPVLIAWTAYEPTAFFRATLNTKNSFHRYMPDQIAAMLRRPYAKSCLAVEAFRYLGTNATQAVPALTRIMRNTNRPFASVHAVQALSYIGSDAFAPLLAQLADPNPRLRSYTVTAIGHMSGMGTNAAAAIPLLVKYTRDKDPTVGMHAALALGNLHLEPEKVVPELTLCLHSTNHPEVRQGALWGLKGYCTNAKTAVPLIIQSFTDPDASIRQKATNALKAIAPELLTNSVPAQ